MNRNDFYLTVPEVLGPEWEPHFKLFEFEDPEGLVMVHPSVIVSLERVRADLCTMHGADVPIRITCGVRTHQYNERLAARLGWTDEGGAVSRTSKHLPEYGGIAVDIVADKIGQRALGKVCRRYFDFVKDDYGDGHVHADNRGA